MDDKKITIQYNRERKINPALIDKQFNYGAELVSFGLYVQVDADCDLETETAKIKAFVNAEIESELQDTVARLRKVARSRIFFLDAIKKSFIDLLATQNLSDDEIIIAWDQFSQRLEIEQAAVQY